MKKRIFVAILAFSVLGCINVFAEQSKLPALETKAIEDLPKELPISKTIEENNMESQYMIVSGKIESVEKEKDYYMISVTNDNMGMRFTANTNAFIVNSKDGSFMTFDELQNGMDITGIVKNGPMTMSLPPMTNAVGFVVGTENFTAVGYFDEELTSQDTMPMLQLNISDETKIVDVTGSRQIFVADDIQNKDCVVVYGASTRSIPAQTTPIFVMILQREEIAVEPQIIEPEAEPEMIELIIDSEEPETIKPEPTVELIPLRETAEKEGFTITWNGNDKPVILQKEGITITITVGKAEYTVEKFGTMEVLESEKTAELIQSKIYIGSDIIQ